MNFSPSPPIEGIVSQAREHGVLQDEHLPFLLTPQESNGFGVLLVHGFTASPWEMLPLAQILTRQGFTTMGVRLPGHGTSPEDLAIRRQEEWQQAVEDGYQALGHYTENIFGIGLSTGALLLITLAARRPLWGMVLLSPFLRVRHLLAPAAGLLRFAKRYQHRYLPPESAGLYYDRRPLNGIHQLNRLCRVCRRLAGEVSTPTLLVNGSGDKTIRVASSLTLFRLLASGHKVFHLYGPEVGHSLTAVENPRREELYDLIRYYLDHWTRRSESPSAGQAL